MTTEDKSIQNQGYKGWTNRETWLINMWFGDDFIYEKIKKDGVRDTETLKDILEEYILSEQGYDESRNGYITDVLAFTLCEVNWKEIFDHYAPELESENYNYDSKGNWIGNVSNENGWTPQVNNWYNHNGSGGLKYVQDDTGDVHSPDVCLCIGRTVWILF